MGTGQKTFLELLHENQGLVHKICNIYRDSKEDREDLFQEIVYQLLRSYPKFEGRSKLSTWMYRIGLNTAMATFRKQRIRTVSTERIPEPAPERKSDDPDMERLLRAIRQLDDAEKAIVTMYLEGFDNTEMASVMGISKNYLSVRLSRIKDKLRTILNP